VTGVQTCAFRSVIQKKFIRFKRRRNEFYYI